MRRHRKIGFTVLLAVGVLFATTAEAQQEQDLRAQVRRIVEAWTTLDITKVEPFYAKDADLTFFDIAPMKYANWGEYGRGVQEAFFKPNRSIKFTLKDDLQVHRRGGLAWATFTFGADIVSKQGASSHVDGRWTLILEKRKKAWIVVHEHVSAPLPG